MAGALTALAGALPAHADSIRDRQWHLKALNVAAAHRISEGDGVIVAVIDTGVKADHPDLAGNVLPGIDQTGENSKGWRDTDGHGTGMAGLIAAHGHGTGQDSGVMGIAPRAKILPIRTKTEKIGTAKNLASAVDQAVQQGATVISMSLGTGTNPAFEQALQRALNADVVIVGSTGNKPNDVFVSYPARYPGVVAVGATGRDGTVAPITVTGKEMVLTAPGTDIVSTDGIGGYSTGTGTSGATALVAGAAALIRSTYPDLTATEVIQRLTTTATDKGKPGRDPQYGYGALDLVAALSPAVPAGAAQTPLDPPRSSAPAVPATTTDNSAAGSSLRPSPALYAAIGLLAALVLLGGPLLVWLLLRRRRA